VIDDIILQDLRKVAQDLATSAFAGKKVLVTGGAGFIGSWICDVLTNLEAEVTCLDDLSTGRAENVDHLAKKSNFAMITCDVCEYHGKDKFDFIFHFASHASPEEYQTRSIETLRVSSLGTANMAELARRNDATLLFASTSEVYGDAEVVPTPESYWGKVNPIGPRSCYDEGKRFAEALLVAYYKQYHLKVRIPRIFNTYGPRLREDGLYGRAVSRFTAQALEEKSITIYGDGSQTRSFCYITDTLTALLQVAAFEKGDGEVVNIGNSQEIAILELANRVKTLTNCKSPLIFRPLPRDDPRRRCPDISRIENMLKWKPKVPFEQGLKRTVAWFSDRKLGKAKS